ncbi:nudix hydrolase 2-like [Magnolia sinica]|uniref:nudix hydrolase 2-like n=1 Tax=Magnolia sinica TaxID=86752 RepID=UPI002657C730|nr:nudix hydrolase 2-like [Magnolia sinica]
MLRSLYRPLPILCISLNESLIRSSYRPSISTVQSTARAVSLLSRFATSKGYKDKAASHDYRAMPTLANPSSSVLSTLADDEEAVELLVATNDTHGGVIVDMKVPMDSEAFVSSLRASISHWRKQGKKGIWIKMPIELVNLVQAAVEEGFSYHHAEPTYLMLVYWIPATVNTLPINATHRIGVGGFVMNDRREVLVVQEKGGKLQGTGVWKFPTGVVNEGEDIYAGAVREVKEETGIDTEFVEVLAFRQSHKSFFEKSDLFFICMLRPLSSNIQKQETEIEAAQWMPIEEYASQPFVQKHELFKYVANICLAKTGKGYSGFSPVCAKSSLSGRQSQLYLNSRDVNQP